MEKNKRGRKKNGVTQPIAAFSIEPIEFIGFYVSSYQAAKVIFDKTEYSQRVYQCANYKVKNVKGFIFEKVNFNEGLTPETIKKLTEKVTLRYNRTHKTLLKFTPKIIQSMSNEDYEILENIFKKYSETT